MSTRIAILTHALDGFGPPALDALAAEGYETLCHSESFADPVVRADFEKSGPHRIAAFSHDPLDLCREALERFGRVDAVVSNDIGDPRRGDFTSANVEDYRALLDVFAIAPFQLIASIVPAMQAQGTGRIILLSSTSGLKASPQLVLYSAARAASQAMVKSLAAEMAPFGISVNAIAALLILSNFFPGGADDPALAALVDQLIPMKRFGQPSEIGSLIGLLASGRADYISGQIIAVSGAGA